MRRQVIVSPQHGIFAISVYATQLVLGFLHLFDVATPNSLIQATDERVALVWSCGLIVTSAIALIGAFGRDEKVLSALAREGWGCCGLTVLNGLYVSVLFGTTGGKGVVTTVTTLAILTLATFYRFVECLVQRGRTERSLRSALVPVEHHEWLDDA